LKLGAEKGLKNYLMIFCVFHAVAMFAIFYVLVSEKSLNITILIGLVFISNLSIGALQVLISSQIVEHSRHQHIETDHEEFSRFNHSQQRVFGFKTVVQGIGGLLGLTISF
jgi:hypothetical protein